MKISLFSGLLAHDKACFKKVIHSHFAYMAFGVDGMNQCGVLPLFHGVAVHDCWTPSWKYTEVGNHDVCCAHILRELTGVIENSPSQIWTKSMKKLLLKMKQARDNAVGAGKEKLSDSLFETIKRPV